MTQENNDTNTEQSLYAKRKKLYPREVHGLYASLRFLGVIALLGLFYLIPWLQWDGHQAVLFDLPNRKFYLFELVLWPQDFIYLAVLLIIAGVSLFFFTALGGRLWCGYACPQTVWSEVFLWIERKIEGSRNEQIKLDNSPLCVNKCLRKFAKHFIWIVFSLYTGFTFVGYFTPMGILADKLVGFSTGPWETFWVFFYSLATYLNAGWMREQVCIYMCPYARFQSAMFDKDTLIISYDTHRGEPRAPVKKEAASRDKGDCVDCGLCVQVCPTGIDIRDGLQYQCIGCAACIDVCNDVMDKVGFDKGLVRYTTQNRMEGKETHILRPRIALYGFVLALIIIATGYSFSQRLPIELDIIRDRNSLYRETREGMIENVYTLKLVNMTKQDQHFTVTVSGMEHLQLATEINAVVVPAGTVVTIPARLQIDPIYISKTRNDVFFHLKARDNEKLSLTERGRFLSPLVY